MDAAQVLEAWEDISKKTSSFGTSVHNFAENYAVECLKPNNNSELGVVQWWMDMPEHLKVVSTETIMYSSQYMYGGTADVILYNEMDDSIVIADYKTNKDLFKNYNKYMLEPFEDMIDNPFNKYQLQFSHYQICLEEKGFNVSRRILIHLTLDGTKYYKNYDTVDYTSQIKEHYGHYTTTY